MGSSAAARVRAAIAAGVVCCLAVGCSSSTRGAAADAGSEAGEEGGACPASEPAAGSECTGDQMDCPYLCGTTYCSCPAGFWVCSVVLHGDGGACAAVDGTTVPQEGAACAQACGPYVGDTCGFVCPGGGPVSAECETGGWHVLGECGGDAGGD